MRYADDCVLPGANAETTTSRLTNLDTHAKSLAGMVISLPKTKAQHIMIQPRMFETTENDITSLLPEKARGFWHGIEGERKQNSQRETYHCDQLGESSVMA